MSQEVVMLMGYPASGKSTIAKEFVEKGYTRINRDTAGGKTVSGVPHMVTALSNGKSVVLDNTFRNQEVRQPFVEAANVRRVPVRCMVMKTTIEQAQFNAARRMVQTYGKIFSPEEIKTIGKKNPNCFPAAVLFAYRKAYEKPTMAEGFASVEQVPFDFKLGPEYTNEAIIFDADDTIRVSVGPDRWPTSPDHVQLLPGRREKFDAIGHHSRKNLPDDGIYLLGVSNQSAIAKGELTWSEAIACFDKTNELLGVDVEWHFCPHSVPPINCYCRKPMPGLGAYFVEKYKLDPSKCIMVGDQTSDKTFAGRCGFQFQHATEFFNEKKYDVGKAKEKRAKAKEKK